MVEKMSGLMLSKEPEIPVDFDALSKGKLPQELLHDLDIVLEFHKQVKLERLENGAVRFASENPFYDFDAVIKSNGKAANRIKRFIACVGERLLLDLKDSLQETDLGVQLLNEILHHIARTDPERALAERMRLEEEWGHPLTGERLEEVRNVYAGMHLRHKREALKEAIDENIGQKSAESFVRAYELARKGEEALGMKYVESDVAYRVKDFFTVNFAKRKTEILKIFRGLPGDFPELAEIGAVLVHELNRMHGRAEWDEESRLPELLLLKSITAFGVSNVEENDRLYDQIHALGNRETFLARIPLGKLTPKKAKHVAGQQFDLYIKYNPALIGEQIDVFADKFVALDEKARESVFATAPQEFSKIVELTKVVPSEEFVDGMAKEMVSSGRWDWLISMYQGCGYVFDPDEKLLKKIRDCLVRMQSLEIDRILPVQRGMNSILSQEKRVSVPWTPWLERLENLQAHTGNKQYDPWITDLHPLVYEENSRLDEKSEDGGEVVYEFVRRFGMVNLPTIFSWHLAIQQARDIKSISENIRQDMEKALGKNFRKMPNKGFLYLEIKKFIKTLQRELLEDGIPQGIDTPVGAEVLRHLVGTGSWSRNENDLEFVNVWKKTLANNPEVGFLGPEHRIKKEAVHLRQRLKLTPEAADALEEQWRKVCEKPDVKQATAEIVNAFGRELGLSCAKESFMAWKARAEAVYQGRIERAANQGDIHSVKYFEDKLALVKRVDYNDEKFFLTSVFSFLAAHQEVVGNDEALREFSAHRIWLIMPVNMRKELDEQFRKDHDKPSAKVFLGRFIQEYLAEHFLNPNHTKKLFDEGTYAELARVWRLEQGAENHPLCRARDEIGELTEKFAWKKSLKTAQVELVPAKGLLRIFSGDIGDACYTKLHEQLAQGQYPGITAYVFVTNSGTAAERLRGSVLFIQTQDQKGRPVIVVRANNPQEGLIQQMDPGELNDFVLEAARELAARTGAKDVFIPLDCSGMSSTNRPEVAKYYRKRFRKNRKISLIDSPETNFNNYDIWNADGDHAVVSVGLESSSVARETAV